MEKKIALFPGSFDPFTIGHESILRRALPLFDSIVIAIGINSAKTGYFSLETRLNFIKELYKEEPKIEVSEFDGLTVDFCKSKQAQYILRGLRTSADFEYERAIGQMNKAMHHGIETVFLLTQPEHTFITSTIVREVLRYGGDASIFLPERIHQMIKNN